MIRVLVVEDEPIAADAHVMYVGRVPGFTVAGRAATAAEALRVLEREPVDLVLLDLNLPDMHGLDVVRAMRAAGHPADVIAVTSARDLDVVRSAVSQGIVQYLLKPFAFAALRDKLERYGQYREQLAATDAVAGQQEVDGLLATLRGQGPAHLPKGMSPESLSAVAALVRAAGAGRSAAEVAQALSASRVTARRYLEHLAEQGAVVRHLRYRGAGRPEVEYRWKSALRPASVVSYGQPMIAAVRRLGAEDWQLWREVRLAALADAPEAFGSTLEREAAYDEAQWRARLAPERGLKAVAVANLAVAAGAIGAWVPEDRGGAAELYSMWVHPSWRGRGVGDALVAEALAWAREQGHQRVDLWVMGGNAAAQRLYERHGFRLTEQTQPHPRDPAVLERVMTVEL